MNNIQVNSTYKMMYVKIMRSIALVAVILLSIPAVAQYEQDIISVGVLKLEVREAYKIKDIPSFKDTLVSIDSLQYSVIPKLVPTSYELQDIKAAKIKVQPMLKRLYHGYVKAGVGTYTTPLLALHFNSLRSRDWAYGIQAHHFSSNGGIKDYAHSGYSDNAVGGWIRKSLKKHSLEFGTDYEYNKVHYYGFKPQDIIDQSEVEGLIIDADDIKHRLRSILFNTNLKSYYRDSSKVNHKIDVTYRSSKNNFDSKEGNFQLVADLNTYKNKFKFMLRTRLDINAFESYRVKPFDFMDVTIVPSYVLPIKQNNAILEFAPQINAVVGDLRANIGVGIAFDIDNTTAIRFFPRGYAKYSLFSDLFTIYAGLEGGLDRNSFYSLFNENPFIRSEITLRNTYNIAELYAGVRGAINKDLSFNVRVGTQSFSTMPLFVNTDTLYSVENRFDVIYENGTRTEVIGEVSYQQSDRIKLFSKLTLTRYDMKNLEYAWHKPGRKLNIGASYNLLDKFILSLDVFAEGKRYAPTYSVIADVDPDENGMYVRTLKGFFDTNLKLEYRYTKRVTAFLQFNNLTGGKYKRWDNYPVQQLMVLGGVSYSF